MQETQTTREAAERLRRLEASDAERQQQWEKARSRVMERMQGQETAPEQSQALETKPEQSDNPDVPKGTWPATASTEIGKARQVEAGSEEKEVKNFDSRRPEGWHPGGPEGRW